MAGPRPRPPRLRPPRPSRPPPSRRIAARDAAQPARSPAAQTGAARPARRWRIPAPLRWLGALLLLVLLAIVALVLLFRWNWLRGPIDDYATVRLGRPVAIHGDLSGRVWSWTPSLTARDVSVAEPRWAGAGDMARLPKLTVALDLRALLRGRFVLSLVDAEQPAVTLIRDASGRENWSYGAPASGAQSFKLPPIHRLVIADGRMSLDDARRKLSFAGVVSSNERLIGYGHGRFTLTGRGAIAGEPFQAQVLGGPLIDVDPGRPYPFQADIRSGASRIVADGALARPFDLGRFAATGRVSGDDMANLYRLTGLTLPNTPPFALAGHLRRDGDRFDVTGLTGRVGSSDVAGRLLISDSSGRRDLTGDLASRRLNLPDLTAVVGGAPQKVVAGGVTSPLQKAAAAKLSAEGRVFPDARLDVERVRQMDADVRYRAETVSAGPLPVRQVSFRVRLDHGVLTVAPLSFVLPQGALSGRARVDARGATPVTGIDLTLANAQAQNLLPKTAGPPPLTGSLEARARISGAGDSVRTAAAHADGVVAVVIPQGQMRQLLAELMGIDVGRSLFLYLSHDTSPTPVRCAVAEFRAEGGVMTAQRILIDTSAVQAQGKGVVDLRNETVDLTLNGRPKHFRLLRVAAPITLKGRLDHPQFGVDVAKALPQASLSALLGVFAAPVAAVLPFIAPGQPHDANCAALLAEAATHGAPVSPAMAVRQVKH
jgi:uncharacterized protein involved in outer membrane biogenesis